ncbi:MULTISPECIES: DUF3168 domain-containing protein [unclassified Bosea (in: a-proteobacteria)]|uniref:DUF3168 domain-containing protein n=1 Tax=unclassified Bosea (in: a-proteobacteria) TaxID=2653178 RepID=UPI000F74CE06|nr:MULTISPECIES: DUF3168 domain-containing protein [unclassified Bosea (in: a-proteobacteria)]AZO77486.1 hypothetical protein BLM15_07570 [Bosea sp. Tri-49]RXT18091.1 hypothetical protein B5U98_22720 [Bosea sp. Tri-39]RXT32689.1 hypothetical protein B5U99_29065 [Bosea sp. Tri-54]
MADPSLALQGAINTRLRAQVTAVGNRVFDRVPADVAFPYIELGEFQTLDDGAQCHDGQEVFVTLHVWSRAVGQVEAKTIAGVVRGALHEAELSLGIAWQFLEIAHQDTRYLKDPDGLTSHAVLTFRALVAAA